MKIKLAKCALSPKGLQTFNTRFAEMAISNNQVDTEIPDAESMEFFSFFQDTTILNGLSFDSKLRLVQCHSIGPHTDRLASAYHILGVVQGGGTLYVVQPDLSISEEEVNAGEAAIIQNTLPHCFIGRGTELNRFVVVQITEHSPHFDLWELRNNPITQWEAERNMTVEGDTVYWSKSFDYDSEVEEAHDRAWSLHCDLSEDLRMTSFIAVDSGSDNDTVWATIRRRRSDERL